MHMEIFRLVFSPIEVNTYILANESNNCAIIDCGCYDRKEFNTLVRLIEEKGLNPVLILNTHSHLDHVFGNGFLLEKYNLKPLASELDEVNRIRSAQHASLFGLCMDTPPVPESFVTDGQIITFGEVTLKALHVPGHSPGSIAYYASNENCIFTGDALFAGSIGRTDLEGGHYQTLIESITEKLFTLPPDTIVYPGHGRQTTIGTERMTNPFFS
jgi:hydroxyacylglutathione hydrolase